MLHQLSTYIAVALLAIGVFYCLHIGAGVINLYLRHIDRLPIDREDVQKLTLRTRNVFFFLAGAALVYYLGLPISATALLVLVILKQLLQISGLISHLERLDLNPWNALDKDDSK